MRLVHRWTGLSLPVKYFTDCSKAVLLLWIIYVIPVLFCYAFMHVCLLMPCGHLLGKGWHLVSFVMSNCDVVISHWYPGSGVVLDCIDSWSLPSFLLCKNSDYIVGTLHRHPISDSTILTNIENSTTRYNVYWNIRNSYLRRFQPRHKLARLLYFMINNICQLYNLQQMIPEKASTPVSAILNKYHFGFYS